MCPSSQDGMAEDGDAAPGLGLLHAEMARQSRDALAAFEAVRAGGGKIDAGKIAARIRAAGGLVLLGMGASHRANRMALAAYRAAGVTAFAEPLSEALRQKPPAGCISLIASQSGGSGEIAAWLARFPDRDGQFGLTLDGGSLLARSVPSLVAPVPKERPFAATRSIMVTLALHAAILDALGHDVAPLLALWQADEKPPAPPEEAVAALASCRALYLASRQPLHSAFEAAALTFMELGRLPALALELGQLLHGPMETLSPGIALVLARPAGADGEAVARVAQAAAVLGVRPILFDLSGDMAGDVAIPGAVTVPLPRREGLAAVAALLPAAQALVIEAAARRIGEGFGRPLRSAKISDGESP
jgi:fructoselysine-6-P-deglycase FrlB-like protein